MDYNSPPLMLGTESELKEACDSDVLSSIRCGIVRPIGANGLRFVIR